MMRQCLALATTMPRLRVSWSSSRRTRSTLRLPRGRPRTRQVCAAMTPPPPPLLPHLYILYTAPETRRIDHNTFSRARGACRSSCHVVRLTKPAIVARTEGKRDCMNVQPNITLSLDYFLGQNDYFRQGGAVVRSVSEVRVAY